MFTPLAPRGQGWPHLRQSGGQGGLGLGRCLRCHNLAQRLPPKPNRGHAHLPKQHVESRRRSAFVTPVPKPKKRRRGDGAKQSEILFKDGEGISTEHQQYDPNTIINEIRGYVDQWRALKNPEQWQVTPETARLLQHWRQDPFQSTRPFFCQLEAIETAIWLAEVAPRQGDRGSKFLDYLKSANAQANPEIFRVALKLATGAGKTTVIVGGCGDMRVWWLFENVGGVW